MTEVEPTGQRTPTTISLEAAETALTLKNYYVLIISTTKTIINADRKP